MSEGRLARPSDPLGEPAATLALLGTLTVLVWLGATDSWSLFAVTLALTTALVAARRHWVLAPLLTFAFLMPLPFPMWYSLVGEGTFSLLSRVHPGTLFLLALLAFGWRPSLDTAPPVLSPTLAGERLLAGLQTVFVVVVGGMSVAQRGLRGLPLLLDNFIGPFVLYWLALWAFRSRLQTRTATGAIAAGLGVLLGVIGVIEFAAGRNPLYEPFYGEVPWFPYPTGEYRSTLTFGAPLAAANALLLLLVAVTSASALSARVVGVLFILAGVLTTGSRSAAALAVGASMFVVLGLGEGNRTFESLRSKRALAIGLGTFAAALCLLVTPLGDVVLHRVLGSWQSTAVRVLSAEYFQQSAGNYVTHGVGLGGSTDVSTAALGSYVTFENPWIMLAVDVGIPLAAFYLCMLVSVVIVGLRWRPRRWAVLLTAFVLVVMESAYNAFGVRSLAGYDLWMALAFVWPDKASYTAATRS